MWHLYICFPALISIRSPNRDDLALDLDHLLPLPTMENTPPHLTQTALDDVLSQLANGLSEILGNQLVKVYLYGSYARGEAYYGSDIDILIVVKGEFDYFDLMDKTSDLSWGLSLENDIVISRLFISDTDFNRQDSPFLVNVHQEAIPV